MARIADLDPILGHLLDNDPHRSVRAVLCRGLTAGHSPGYLRLWLRSRGGTAVAQIVDSPGLWSRHVYDARRRVSQPVLPAAAARRLVAHLLAPLPGSSARRQVTARATLALVGLQVVDSIRDQQFDTALTSRPRLGVALNLTDKPITAALDICQETGALRLVSRRHRGASRWRLGRVPKSVDAWRWADTIQALADGDTDKVADVIRAAQHPAVAYGVAWPAWVVALADAAGMDPVEFGIGKTALARLRKTWPGVDGLDAYAAEHACAEQRDSAEKARAQTAAVQAEQREEVVKVRGVVRREIETLIGQHPVPSWTATTAEKDAWFDALAALFATDPLPVEHRPYAARLVSGRLLRRGYPLKVARRIGAVLVGLPEPVEDAA